MKCQILFSGKNKKNISKCHLLKILPRVLRVNDGFSEMLTSSNMCFCEERRRKKKLWISLLIWSYVSCMKGVSLHTTDIDQTFLFFVTKFFQDNSLMRQDTQADQGFQ